MRDFAWCSHGNVCCQVAPAWGKSDQLSTGQILQNQKLRTGTDLGQSQECGEEGGAQRLLLGRLQQSPNGAKLSGEEQLRNWKQGLSWLAQEGEARGIQVSVGFGCPGQHTKQVPGQSVQ